MLNYNIAGALQHIQVIYLAFLFFPVVAHLLHKIPRYVPTIKVRADGGPSASVIYTYGVKMHIAEQEWCEWVSVTGRNTD